MNSLTVDDRYVSVREGATILDAARATAARPAADVPLGRIGEPEELAAAIGFLASDRASRITGTVLAVDGDRLRGIGRPVTDPPVAGGPRPRGHRQDKDRHRDR